MAVSADGAAQRARQLEGIRILANTLFAHVFRDTVDVRNESQIFDARQKFVQIRIVRQKRRHLLCRHGFVLYGMPVDDDLSLGKIQNARHGAQCCGLACAVVADKAHDLACIDGQRQIVNSLFAACIRF